MPKYGKITDEALATLRARIGRTYNLEEPYNREVTKDAIRHFIRAIGDPNPLWTDDEYAGNTRYGASIAPPCWLYSVHWGSWDFRRGRGLPGVHGLHAGDRWHFFKPLTLGMVLNAKRGLVGLDEKFGKFAGRQFLQRDRVEYRDHTGELVAYCYMSSMRVDRDAGRKKQKYADIEMPRYSAEDLAKIEADYDAEVVRGAEPRYFEDVQAGDELTPVVKGPYTSADSVAWVMGAGSPHIRLGRFWLDYRRRTPAVAVPNPETGVPEPIERVHWDNYMAQEIGMPAAYDYGSHRGAFASHLLTNWAGDDGFVKRHDVKYRGMVFLGDTVWFKGKVTRTFRESGNAFVEVELVGENQRGEYPLKGTSVVALPSRDSGPVQFPVCLESDPMDSGEPNA
ncbi:FAS1-like dehydratase domain-containing protein [Actinophytocola sp.]|uniref:FAS1-like dehydratase domain-containing protein n=1 Tax=Actinophytocola sp. TaxID=1872138 RepID=UPI003D6A60A9